MSGRSGRGDVPEQSGEGQGGGGERVVGHAHQEDAADRARRPERLDGDAGPDALQGQGGGEGDTDAGGDHGLGFLVVVRLVGDVGLEADGAAAADKGFGHRVMVGAGDPGVVCEVGERGGDASGERMVVADEKGGRVVEEGVTTMSSRSIRLQS